MKNLEINEARVAVAPETFRIPKSGERDAVFGLSRAFYYAAEAEGRIKLIRVRKPGNVRGITLVPASAVRKLISAAEG